MITMTIIRILIMMIITHSINNNDNIHTTTTTTTTNNNNNNNDTNKQDGGLCRQAPSRCPSCRTPTLPWLSGAKDHRWNRSPQPQLEPQIISLEKHKIG